MGGKLKGRIISRNRIRTWRTWRARRTIITIRTIITRINRNRIRIRIGNTYHCVSIIILIKSIHQIHRLWNIDRCFNNLCKHSLSIFNKCHTKGFFLNRSFYLRYMVIPISSQTLPISTNSQILSLGSFIYRGD